MRDSSNLAAPGRVRWFFRSAAFLVGACGFAGGVFAVASFAREGSVSSMAERAADAAVPPVLVSVTPASREDGARSSVGFVGEVRAARSSVVSFDLGGTVMELLADDGDLVAAGAPLARLDTRRLKAALAEARARLAQAEADRVLAVQTLGRLRDALERRAIAETEVEEAERGLASAEAAIEVAQSAIRSVEVDIEKSTITAPFDAVVSRRLIDPGAVALPGTPIVRVLEVSAPEARIGVSASVIADLAVGGSYTIDVGGRDYASTLTNVLPMIDPASRTAEAVFVLDTDLTAVREGELARVTIAGSEPGDDVAVPAAALVASERGLFAVYVAEPLTDDDTEHGGTPPRTSDTATHRVSRRDVQVIAPGTETAFVSGFVSTGELVVTDGMHKVVPGLEVRLSGG